MNTYQGIVPLCSLKTRKVFYWNEVNELGKNYGGYFIAELYIQSAQRDHWKIVTCDISDNAHVDEFLEHAILKYEHVKGK